jgi:adenylate cyclase
VTEPVALESILSCFRGVIPSVFATCGPDGVPNVTYMSIVQYVDSERIALSRQFFNKTSLNLDANPASQVLVVDPETAHQYTLDLQYLKTETHGSTFDAMRTSLDAVASQTGMSGVFRLRGIDIHRVVRCAPVGEPVHPRPQPAERDVLAQLDELTRRIASCRDYEGATRTALHALDDLFRFGHSILLVRDDATEQLFAVAGNGYPAAAAGAEVAVGEGVIGTAAASRQVVCIPHLGRSRVMQAAMRSGLEQRGDAAGNEIPLPGLDGAQSVAAVPLVAQDEVRGVLYLESDRPGVFGPHNERLLRVLGRHLGALLRGFDVETPDRAPAETAPVVAVAQGAPLRVSYYQADDSVFAGGEYVIKGVPGRILWQLLKEHVAEGRTTFTNRELRLDESLGLPAGSENLEARLLVLRKRLAGGAFGIELERVGRGRLALRSARPLELSEVATTGPMRAAHAPPQ